jgi:tetratricopeptide (TPR) repeat protein
MLWKRFRLVRPVTTAEAHAKVANKALELLTQANQVAAAGEHERAVEVLNQSLAIEPDYLLALLTLIQILAHLRRYDEALDACARVLKVDPHNIPVIASMEQILPIIAQFDGSEQRITLLSQCLAAKPNHDLTWTTLTQLLIRAGRHREALEVCQRALQGNPGSKSVYNLIYEILSLRELELDIAARASSLLPRGAVDPALFEPTVMRVYEKLAAINIVDTLVRVIDRFYAKLGLDPLSTPLVKFLKDTRHKLGEFELAEYGHICSTLLHFEMAWNLLLRDDMDKCVSLLRIIFDDDMAIKLAKYHPFTKEALVRAGEILGRHEERVGAIEGAISVYRRLMRIDQNGVIARRLAVLLWRQGNLNEAASLAEIAVNSKANLYPYLTQNDYILSIRADLASQARALNTKKEGIDPV